jgi:gliding motility-associated-like protein
VEVIFKETTVAGCPFKVVRNWIAVDNCGNQAEATQTIVVVDNQPPVLSAAPANLSLACGTAVPAPAQLTATDDCGLPTTVTMQETDSGTGCHRTIQRTWTATDACGNSSSVSQLITFTDTVAPTGVAPADLTVNCGELPPATTPAFTDNCDQNLSVHFTEIATPVTCGQNVLRTWTATDDCGNSSVVKQLIHVRDLTPPVMTFTNPALMGLNSGDTLLFNCASNIIFNPSDVTATDACSNVAVSLELVDVSNGNCLADGYLMRAKFRWVATDNCGNTSTLSLNVRVEDHESPVFPTLPNIVVNCGDDAPDFIMPDVVDDCGEVALSFASQNVPTGYGHNIVGTWTAVDNCGNSATASQTIQVFDIGAAQLVGVPADITIDLGSGEVVPPPALVTAVNNCNGDTLSLVFDEDIQQLDPCNSVIDRRWSAVGPNGVTVMETQTITVIDNANFTADMVADSCNTSNGSVVLTPASFDFVWSDPNGATGASGAVRNDLAAGTYTVTATNANGCSSVAEVIVEATCNCDAALVKEVRKNVTGCGVSKGKAVIHLVQNVADYNFTWLPNLGVPNVVGNARTSLPAGHYEVTISLNSLASCVTVVSFDIDDDCAGCDEIFAEAPASINAPHGPVDICLPVAYGVFSNYEIRVDGHLFGGMLEPCEPHAVKVYSYSAMPTGGSYSVVWQHNGSTFYTFLQNFAELVAAMNFADPAGKWYDDAASKELVTTRLNGNYGNLSIRHNASGAVTNLSVIATTSNTGTMLTLPSGGHTITYTNTVTGCSDELYVYVGPGETEVAMEQPNEGASSVQPGTEVDSRATAPKAQADGILVYNGFSPNGDGMNDFFKIDGLEQYPEHELKIFNGSGKMVFRTSHYLSDWGGSWGQNNLPDGTYYYLLEDGKGRTYSGYVQIKR